MRPATVNLPLGWTAAAPRFVGNDLRINITSTGLYQTWAGAAPFNGDSNSDGVPNGLAWIFGAIGPNANAVSLLPTIDRTSDQDGKLLFIFRRITAAGVDPNTLIVVEYGSSLTTWTSAVHQGFAANQITITQQTNGFASGIDKVTVALPTNLQGEGEFFARLKATIATP